jgi:hypothetical protein
MNSKKISTLIVFSAAVAMTGCGKGFSASSNLTGSGSNSSTSTGGGGSIGSAAAFKALTVDGTVSGGSDSSTQVIEIDKVNMQLVARIPIPLGSLSGIGITPVSIREIPGATIGLETTPSGGSALALRVPLSVFLKGVALLPGGRLPNGDPLPAVPDGELPMVAVSLGNLIKTKLTIYLAPSVVGIFVDTGSQFSIPIGFTLPIKNSAHTRTWGYLSSVPANTGFDGGVFMSLAVPSDIARIIDDAM